MKVSHVHGIPFRYLTWQDMADLTELLAKKIPVQNESYDRFVALANGGLTMVRHMADLLDINRISLLQIKSYTNINENLSKPHIEQPLQIDVENEHLLIFEDIVDTGNTLYAIHDYMKEKHPASYKIATLVQKSHAKASADYIGAAWDEWIIYPYEVRETIQSLQQKWQEEGIAREEILAGLQEIGFEQAHISQFWVE